MKLKFSDLNMVYDRFFNVMCEGKSSLLPVIL